MYENQTYDVILQRMLDRVSDKLDKRESSLIWDTHSPTAIELQILYIELDTMVRNSYGSTAAREFLILLCRDRGITPEPATRAVLKGEFRPADIDVTGKRFNIGDINYTVTEQIAPGQYQVQCETPGIMGNQKLGSMIPIEYINGLQTAELTEVLIPGEEEEETEALRQRYFSSFNEKAFGGNRRDYLNKVSGIDGVGGLKVTRVWNGDIRPANMIPSARVKEWYDSVSGGLDAEVKAWLSTVYMASAGKKLTVGGTVLITVVNSMDFSGVSDTLLKKIQDELDPEEYAGEGYGLAPIGHVVNVKSAEPVRIDVKTDIVFEDGYGWDSLKSRIEGEIAGYLLELRKAWAGSECLVIRVSHIESRILAIKGVADISDTRINGAESNLRLAGHQVPVPGGVSGW